MFEEIREYLTCLRGFTNIQLMYIIFKILITPLSSSDYNNYVDKDVEMIACASILERGTIAANNEAGLALQATNGPWYSNALIDQRVVYVVMKNVLGTHPVWQLTAGQR